MNDNDKTLTAKIAANKSWAMTEDRSARTLPGRLAMMARFEKQVDPEGKLPPELRAKMAENAKKAYFQQLALKSAKVRRRRAEVRRVR